ncbi:MAG: phosphoenolpyruvate--protein phosphotransferase [Planctomycetota bacterium]|nr:phosphoenolpyruvate--protein phosphotransferase [Planctomycetota bacterium]MDP6989255.1 phosphoenolpyruvate--protein phosphotransferase [Planctomycetota bacterium]
MISGTAVAPGLAMGPVYVVRATPDVVPSWSLRAEEVEGEIARLHEAIAAVTGALEARRRRVAEQTNEQDAEIFAVHRTILEDPNALDRVVQAIRDDRLNAEVCVQRLIEHLEQVMGGLDGDSALRYGADVSEPWCAVLEELSSSERRGVMAREERVVLAAADLTPHVVTYLDRERVLAILTETGGRFSHGGVLARSLGFPCVAAVPNLMSRLEKGMRVIVDGDRGTVQLGPDEGAVDQFLERRRRHVARREALAVHAALPSHTSDGRPFALQTNVEGLRDVETFDVGHTDGVGLFRTEFLYMERSEFPSEEEQYRVYRRLLELLEGRPVTVRTLDIGGDKRLPYFDTPDEPNPQLGWRGLRIALQWADLLRVQLRAALRASAHGDLRLLLPMVSSLDEVRETKRIFEGVRDQLTDQGYEIAEDVPVGIMVEVPSVLFVLPEILEEVDFVSVGTNDMVQYLLAADRDNPWVAHLYDPYHPAVLRALQEVAEASRRAGKPCSVCGEMAGDYATALVLLGLGYSGVSMAPNFVGEVKYALRQVTLADARELARQALREESAVGVRALLEEARRRLHDSLTGEETSTS